MIFNRRGICLLAATLLLSACAASPQPRYYTLGLPTAADNGDGSVGDKAYNIAVGPIAIPEVVDRPQIVLQTGPNQVAILEEHRWAQPLKSEIARFIAASLTEALTDAWVTDSHQRTGRNIDYQLSIDVQRFESLPREAVTVEAQWVVRRAANGETKKGKSLVRESVNHDSYDALVAAHARAFESVSREIAAAVKSF